jgi:hypothetical protein
MFKVALRTSDEDLGTRIRSVRVYSTFAHRKTAIDCLARICEFESTDHRVLYACALDAQAVGSMKLALRAMQYILDRLEKTPAVAQKLPILIRCTIKMTMTEIEGTRGAQARVEIICGLYEKGEFIHHES